MDPTFAAAPAPKSAGARWDGALKAERFEWRLRLWAIPVALVGTWLLTRVGPGRFVLRTFFGMWLHEGGHAAASWLCGYSALPLPWVTWTSDTRSVVVTLALVGALGWLGFLSLAHRHFERLALCGLFIAAALGCRFALGVQTAQAFITFAGDAGALVFGALLVGTFTARRDSQVYRGALRWGFLVIGAASFSDVTAAWLAAKRDPGEIPFGTIEGVGLSDASKLAELHGWGGDDIVRRTLVVAALAFVFIAVVYVRGVLESRRRLARAERGEDPDEALA